MFWSQTGAEDNLSRRCTRPLSGEQLRDLEYLKAIEPETHRDSNVDRLLKNSKHSRERSLER